MRGRAEQYRRLVRIQENTEQLLRTQLMRSHQNVSSLQTEQELIQTALERSMTSLIGLHATGLHRLIRIEEKLVQAQNMNIDLQRELSVSNERSRILERHVRDAERARTHSERESLMEELISSHFATAPHKGSVMD